MTQSKKWKNRTEELLEKKDEFILNESVFADKNPSWGEVADAQSEAEIRWNETDEGKELIALLERMSHNFKVIYTNGEYYYTQANGTANEFEAYLKQDGGHMTFEDSNGKEFHRYIDRVEEIELKRGDLQEIVDLFPDWDED